MSTVTTSRTRARVRSRISGTAERPRLSIHVTNRHITAQLINDLKAATIAYVTTVNSDAKGSLSEQAKWVGEEIAKAAKEHKIKRVVFDRGSRIYHGRLHQLAEAARQNGLEF